jgi:steroid delta-isomerase-like uncharacterized protein
MSSTQEQNKDVVRHYITEADHGNHDILLDVMTEDVRIHVGEAELDRDTCLAMFKSFYAAFPDLSHEFQDLFAVDDRVVLRALDSGTHRGEFMGIAPTGRAVKFSVIAVFRFEGGRIAEVWEEADMLGLLGQLGVKVSPDAV